MRMLKQGLVLVIGCLIGFPLTGCDQAKEGATPTAAAPKTGNAKLIEVSTDNFEQVVLKNDKPVLVDFWAPWCGPCVKLMPTMEEMASKYDGELVIVKVNVDEQAELANQYKITGIPRLIYFKNGEVMIDDGDTSRSGLENEINSILKIE